MSEITDPHEMWHSVLTSLRHLTLFIEKDAPPVLLRRQTAIVIRRLRKLNRLHAEQWQQRITNERKAAES